MQVNKTNSYIEREAYNKEQSKVKTNKELTKRIEKQIVSSNDTLSSPTSVITLNEAQLRSAYAHSRSTHAPVTAQANADITKSEIEAKLTGTITTHAHTITRTYTIPISCSATNPTDTTHYYLGIYSQGALQTTADFVDFMIPISGTITNIYLKSYNSTLGTNENWPLYVNQYTNSTLVGNQTSEGANLRIWQYAGLNISVSATTYPVFLFLDSPTWVTNPVDVTINGFITISY